MIKKLAIGLFALVLLLVLTTAVVLVVTAPPPPAPGSNSRGWLEPGPHEIGTRDFVFIDSSRPTPRNGEFAGAPQRTFNTTLWYPLDATGYLPFVLYSHGLLSTRTDLDYVARHLASYGYVVAAADYPLTNIAAPGGANPADLVNQPSDVTFLIDAVLALAGERKPFNGQIDLERIGLAGYSLGGLTATLVTFHPRFQDPRVSAMVSIAGPAALFTRRFFENGGNSGSGRRAPIPFLMIAGSADVLIDYQVHAASIPRLVPGGALLTVRGGTHLGFTAMADPLLRFVGQPDTLGCRAVLASIGEGSSNDIYRGLGTVADGIEVSAAIPEICATLPTDVLAHPGRQQMITRIAVLSFFQSVFALQPRERQAAAAELAVYLPGDFGEARYLIP